MALCLRETAVAESHSAVIDEAEFLLLYRRTALPLRGYLLRSVRNPALADDLLQETFLRFLRADFVGEDDEHRRNYLYRIATNLVRDHFRRKKPESELAHDPAMPPRSQRNVELRSDVDKAMSDLAPRDRQMLWLAYVEGSSYDEIATILGLRTSSLKSMLHRARKRLASSLRILGIVASVDPLREDRS